MLGFWRLIVTDLEFQSLAEEVVEKFLGYLDRLEKQFWDFEVMLKTMYAFEGCVGRKMTTSLKFMRSLILENHSSGHRISRILMKFL